MKNLLIVTGVSGGHVIPSISLFEHLKKKFKVEALDDLIVDHDDGLDGDMYPSCTAGSKVIDCAHALPLGEWLQQRWALEEVLEAN